MAARNPYETLGVARTASDAEIRRAFRRLAKEFHPDRNPGNTAAETRFKEVNAAYAILGDPDKRARFDRGEIDANGNERMAHGFGGFGGQGFGHGFGQGFGQGFGSQGGARGFAGSGVDEILASIFGRGGRSGGFDFSDSFGEGSPPPPDPEAELAVDFLEAAKGGTVRLQVAGGRTLDVRIPPGTGDGQVLRLRGQGGPAGGDLLVRIRVRPHKVFRREDDDILADIPMTLAEAVLGGKVTVPTIDGPVAMTVPAGSSGRVLRLRGKGLSRRDGTRGDQLVTLRVALPDTIDPDLEAFIRRWSAEHPYDPRAGLV
ncbi:MAG TPA: J domain-containing protein [Azospirillaceae bacterium]|nr:J domain-containing protein [Azospirillaceae bacterium]